MTLREIHKIHLNSWSGNFVERHSFRIVSSDSSETTETVSFHTWKLDEILLFYGVSPNINWCFRAYVHTHFVTQNVSLTFSVTGRVKIYTKRDPESTKCEHQSYSYTSRTTSATSFSFDKPAR